MAKSNTAKVKGKTADEIFNAFQTLRNEQRQLANKITELEMDLNEHKIVIETLQGVDKSRKCFRMAGGVLIEKTVGDVLPTLEYNKERLPQAIEALNEQLVKKGKEITEFVEAHDIRVHKGHREPESEPEPATKSNVLVSSE